ncbi:predicted protein [Lichtheimia corymbifera JMRC:FSU:9682]|uniref:Uncharacterized protein n=1 Tax=Lichtheimia corymbifera JMRC:FSU:9682 TaxID=1263082 RepID=A0A068S3V3_9FUNG|nr:predicted protein [Lichtheimia corymbifera JMRC:FSU:9682]
MEDRERDRPIVGWEKVAYQQQFWTCNGYGWMDGVTFSGEESWDVVLATWRVISRNDGSYCVRTPEDGDELDDVDKRAYISDERRFAAMDDIGMLEQGAHSN